MPISPSVTVSLVPEARSGPFVYHGDLAAACASAAALGYDAVELFPPAPDAVPVSELRSLLDQHHLALSAVGTGAGWVRQRLSLTAPDSGERAKARDYVRAIVDFAGQFRAVAIIGSMQGRFSEEVPRETALGYLGDALNELGEHARQYGVPLIYEPLNRYETNLCVTLSGGLDLLGNLTTSNVRLLADLFHMNIEESNVAAAIREASAAIGHVHFVDSNRRPAGLGHTDFAPIAAALEEIGYRGYASAEALPYPDSEEAARQTIETYKRYFGRNRND